MPPPVRWMWRVVVTMTTTFAMVTTMPPTPRAPLQNSSTPA
ncbi:hypothetical protein ACWIE7_14800 [Dietzia sp. NPDC055343]